MASVTLRGLRKTFNGVPVLHGIDLDVADGEFVVFVGPSGCGKSTLLRCIAGLEEIDAGDLTIGERRMNEVPPAQRGLAMVFQSYALYPHMTVAENMGFSLRLAGKPRAEIDAAVQRVAEVLQIGHLLQRHPRALSGGQRQRVAIGRAIVRQPGVFLFDEPLSNLDAALRVQMRLELARLHRELGTTILYVTHDQAEAMTLADRIVVFNGGRIGQVGEPLALYRRPANQFVAGFLGSPRINLLPAALAPRFGGGAATLGVRPEALRVLQAGERADLEMPVTVQLVEHLGDTAYLHAQANGVAMVARATPDLRLRPGEAVTLGASEADCLRFDETGATV
ncbi:MAG: sn-glycerol-3-phosphate ABC transporter ATP-binding protein UgpC [Pseudomonadota bacterium]